MLPSDAKIARKSELVNIFPTPAKVDLLSPKDIPIMNINIVLRNIKATSLTFNTLAPTSLPINNPDNKAIITVIINDIFNL